MVMSRKTTGPAQEFLHMCAQMPPYLCVRVFLRIQGVGIQEKKNSRVVYPGLASHF